MRYLLLVLLGCATPASRPAAPVIAATATACRGITLEAGPPIAPDAVTQLVWLDGRTVAAFVGRDLDPKATGLYVIDAEHGQVLRKLRGMGQAHAAKVHGGKLAFLSVGAYSVTRIGTIDIETRCMRSYTIDHDARQDMTDQRVMHAQLHEVLKRDPELANTCNVGVYSWSADRTTVVIECQKYIAEWTPSANVLVRRPRPKLAHNSWLALAPDRETYVAAGPGNTIDAYALDTGELRWSIPVNSSRDR